MGQKVGKASFQEEAVPFVNLSQPSIESLWEAFNDIADGFGVSLYEFKEICAEVKDELNLNRAKMDDKALALFVLLDADKNGLVDGIEFITTIAAVSGMRERTILDFMFTSYDFDGTGNLTIDEVTLAMKGVLMGVCKLTGEKAPPEEELELLALEGFEACNRKETDKVTIAEIVDFCLVSPETKSWIDYLSDATLGNLTKADVVPNDIDHQNEVDFKERTAYEIALAEEEELPKIEILALSESLKDTGGVSSIKEAKEKEAAPDTSRWLKTIEALIPSDYVDQPLTVAAPDASLKLEWVHGYRCDDVRNNVFYLMDGCMIWYIARVAVIYNPIRHHQRFFRDHTEDIISIGKHPDGAIVATGEIGKHPKIIVWDAVAMRSISILKGFHSVAVTHIAFSHDGKKLASLGQDPYHCLAIYDWKNTSLLFSARTSPKKVLSLVFGEQDTVVTGGDDHIYFWYKEGRGLQKKRGVFGVKANCQPVVSLVSSGPRIISGTANGSLYMWVGRNCAKSVRGHMGAINALSANKLSIVSGGKDMRIRIWTLGLEPGPTFNMSSFGTNPIIRSVCMSDDGIRILTGTKGAEIYEISSSDGSDTHGGPITIGHNTSSVRAVATHPSKGEYITVGDDQTLRIWDVATRTMIRMAKLDSVCRIVDYSPDGTLILVVLGGEDVPDPFNKNGSFVILNEGDLSLLHEARDTILPILDGKFSPDGQTLALAGADKTIYLYAPEEEFEIIARCRRHDAPVEHIDFSDDGEWLQSNCREGELLFFNTDKGALQADISAMRDIPWYTQNCTLGWPVRGIHPALDDARKCWNVERSPGQEVLAVGDSNGAIRLYQYPCVAPHALFHEYKGHSAGYKQLRFVFDESYLITVGGEDRCVFQWKFEQDDEVEDADFAEEVFESDGYILEMKDDSDYEREEDHENAVDEYGDILAIAEPRERSAIKPWLEKIVGPSVKPDVRVDTPMDGLEIEWVHGYNGESGGRLVRYNNEGHLIYPAGTLGLATNVANKTQVYCHAHSDEVTCLAAHPEGTMFATGQVGKHPLIAVWNSTTGETLCVMKGLHRRSISCLEFSPCGDFLASIGSDKDHLLVIHEWRTGTVRAKAVTSKKKVLDIAWDPTLSFMNGTRYVLTTVGMKHVTFWEWEGRSLNYRKGIVGQMGLQQRFNCVSFLGSTAIVGTTDGNLYVFEDYKLCKSIVAHTSGVTAISVFEGGILTGSKDGIVKKWDLDLQEKSMFDTIVAEGNSIGERIKSICISKDKTKILIGTGGHEIFELSALNGTDLHEGPVTQSHAGKGGCWGLSINPKNKNQYVTSGDDGTVRLWSLEGKKCTKWTRLEGGTRSVDVSPSGKHIAVGLGRDRRGERVDGGYVILDFSNLAILHEAKDAAELIRCIKYSPDGNTLALGSKDNRIYLYNAKDGYSRRFVLSTHRAPVVAIDFSADSLIIQSSDMAEDLCYHDVTTGNVIGSPSTVKDMKWASWTLPIGFPVKNLQSWFPEPDDCTALQQSNSGDLIAIGDRYGFLRIMSFPVIEEEMGYRKSRGHCAPLRNLKWSNDDEFLISTGAGDGCVIMWKHFKDKTLDSGEEAGESGDDEDTPFDGGLLVKLDPPRGTKKNNSSHSSQQGRQWMSQITPPSNILPEEDSAPPVVVEVDHVHGKRSDDVRNSVYYNNIGEILFHAAGLGIIYDPVTHSQKFYPGAKGNIISLVKSPCGKFVAAGETGEKPHVRIWDAITGVEIITLPCVHKKGIPLIAFSQDGKYLASMGQDKFHSICIFSSQSKQWIDAKREAFERTTVTKPLFMIFTGEAEFPLMVGGLRYASFYYLAGRSLRVYRGCIGRLKKIQTLLCGSYIPAQQITVTGCATGNLYVWKGRKVEKMLPGHVAPVLAISSAELGCVTGGKDGVVKLWDRQMTCVREFNMLDCIPAPYSPIVNSCAVNRSFTKVVVGLKSSEIVEISIKSGKRCLITEGHCKKQLRGLACNPTNPDEYATVGDDGSLRVWSIRLKKCMRRIKLDGSSRAMDWSPDGRFLVVGFGGSNGDMTVTSKDGAYMIIKADNLEVLQEDRKAKQDISDIKFSQCGRYLVVGSIDGKVYVHSIERAYMLMASSDKLADDIAWFDISKDGNVIQAGTPSGEVVLFETETCKRLANMLAYKDVEFSTMHNSYNWMTQGIWPRDETKPFYVTSSDRSKKEDLLAVSCKDGEVRVYRYPCSSIPNKEWVTVTGHRGEVSKVRFNADASHLITLDSLTGSVVQHKISSRTSSDSVSDVINE